MSMETALVFDKEGKTIAWHLPPGRSSGSIPDTRDLWEILWENRAILGGVAHTHPWNGEAHPSHTDVTTFRAIDNALGRNLLWPVVTFTDMKMFVFMDYDPEHQGYGATDSCEIDAWADFELEDLEKLRALSR